jgi:predicted YcjX-like family ATPase
MPPRPSTLAQKLKENLMRKFLAFAVVAVVLSGCASLSTDLAKVQQTFSVITTATVSAPTAQVAVSSFEVIEAATTEYLIFCKKNQSLSACAPGTVVNPGPLRLVIKYDRQGRNARDQIKAAGKSGALISTTAYNLLVDAVTNLTSKTPVTTVGAQK